MQTSTSLSNSIRQSAIALCAAAAIASTAGCIRKGATASVASPPRKALAEKKDDNAPIVPTDRPSGVFTLDGKPFCFEGTNNYYLNFEPKDMVDDVFRASKAMGLKVMRFWGYIDRGSLDGTVPSMDGDGTKNKVYFQYWDPKAKRPAYNEDAATGLVKLDYVLDQAKKYDIKLILVLTNNWRDFGGMDQYLSWYGLNKHYLFYTDESVRKAFKDWIAHLVNRKNTINGILYRDDPSILAWELANEPRAINARNFDSPGWDLNTIPAWADEMSTFIKSMDKNHLVAVGDEGFFKSYGDGTGYGYSGDDGGNHAALVALKNVDFGTFHLYPEDWGTGLRWANQWIEDHIEVARDAGKPTILEEYGIKVRRDDAGNILDPSKRIKAYTRWHDIALARGLNGAMFWMLAGLDDVHGKYPDYDHFVVHEGDLTANLLAPYITKFQTDARACTMYDAAAPAGSITASKFVGVKPPPDKNVGSAEMAAEPLAAISENEGM